MSIVLTDDKYYQDIANVIRSKNGTTTQYKPSEMAAAISNIGGGGIVYRAITFGYKGSIIKADIPDAPLIVYGTTINGSSYTNTNKVCSGFSIGHFTESTPLEEYKMYRTDNLDIILKEGTISVYEFIYDSSNPYTIGEEYSGYLNSYTYNKSSLSTASRNCIMKANVISVTLTKSPNNNDYYYRNLCFYRWYTDSDGSTKYVRENFDAHQETMPTTVIDTTKVVDGITRRSVFRVSPFSITTNYKECVITIYNPRKEGGYLKTPAIRHMYSFYPVKA